MYLRHQGITTNSREKCPAQPSVCHPDREAYNCHKICRSCYDKIRHQGERGRAFVYAEVANVNPTMSEAFRQEVLEKLGSIKQYVQKPIEQRKELNTNNPTVRSHVAKTAILKSMDFPAREEMSI